MRKLALFTGLALVTAPTASLAQAAAPAPVPVAVEFDSEGRILNPNRVPTCAEMRERVDAREAERQRAIAAGEEPPRPLLMACVRYDAPSTAVNRFVVPAAPSLSQDAPIAAAQGDFTLADTRGSARETNLADQSNAARFATNSDFSSSQRGQFGSNPDVQFEASRRETCTDNGYERTCSQSSSFSIGNSDEARETVERMLDRDD